MLPVVVIGAGASGMTALKACLEQGLAAVCLELSDGIGGLWKYRSTLAESGLGCVMKSTIINTSKEMTAFSDFPPPKEFPNFMHNSQLHDYIDLYVDHFRLKPHVRLRHRVVHVLRDEDHDSDGRWIVRGIKEDHEEFSIRASAVMVCSGHHGHPHWPPLRRQCSDTFRGTSMHSHDYRDGRAFEGKRVLVVGMGNSGSDISTELGHFASKVYLSTRRGAWLLPRLGVYGEPLDLQFMRRHLRFLFELFPPALKNYYAEKQLNERYDHELFDLKPRHRFFSQHPTVNDELPGRIASGTVVLKGDVRRFTEDGVVFQGEEERIYRLDAVVFATGYEIRFPFLDDTILPVENNAVSLYKYVFPVHSRHPTLAVIGLVQPAGSLLPVSEMQSRWAVKVFAGEKRLPPSAAMSEDVRLVRHRRERRYVRSLRYTIEVDFIDYMDELAKLVGALPTWPRLVFEDPRLARACLFGPCLPYQYRLVGPHRWAGARDAILHAEDRVAYSLQTRCRRRPEALAMGRTMATTRFAFAAAAAFCFTLFAFFAVLA